MSLSIYHTHTHSLGCMSEIGEALSSVRESKLWRSSFMFLGFTIAIGAHSISKEVAGFFHLWFPQGKYLVIFVVHVILLDKILDHIA